MEKAFSALSEEHQKLARLEMNTEFLDPDLDLNRHAKNVLRLQKEGGLCIDPISFRQLVISIAQNYHRELRFTEEAHGYIQTSTEHYLYSILCKANSQSCSDLGRVILVLSDRDIMTAKASYQRNLALSMK
jgi:histone H3/H4